MSSTKIRHQFLLDQSTSERLNALAVSPGSTKTDIIAQAIKAFLERGSQGEFAQLSTMRLDKISRELETVRQRLEALQDESTLTSEMLMHFILFSFELNAKMSPPDKEMRAIGNERFHKFGDFVARKIAHRKSLSAPKKEGDGT